MKTQHLAAALLLLITPLVVRAADPAPAICLPGQSLYPPSVGDTASDANCDFDTIQAAINAQTCPATIAITREHLYTHQHLSIQNKSITLVGLGDGVHCPGPVATGGVSRTATPAAEPIAPVVTIDGSGDGGRVLSIGGSSHVTLKYLEITGGDLADNPSGDGGGIGFEGTGSLTLDTSTVDNNDADYGGGINFKGTGDENHVATLTLDKNSAILENHADVSGGGIRIEGHAYLSVLQPGTTFIGNEAPDGYGGALEVLGPAQIDIASPGAAFIPVIYDNSAAYGGGIAAISNYDDGSATVRLFSIDPDHPVQVIDNTATHAGGGFYLKGDEAPYPGFGFAPAYLCAAAYRINGNVASEGSAIYGDTGAAHVLLANDPQHAFSTGQCLPGGSAASLAAVSCASGVACNTINGNSRIDSGSSTQGSTILMQDDGQLSVDGLAMQNNIGVHAIRTLDGAHVDIRDCLLINNDASAELLYFEGEGGLDHPGVSVSDCTIADNSLGANSLIRSGPDLSLGASILGDIIKPVTMDGGTLYPGNLLVADNAGLPPYASIIIGNASFVDAAHGDYHLLPTSLGIDFAPSDGGTDLDGRPRDVDLASAPNVYGPRDLGAYERQSALACDDHADAIFCATFETQP